MRNIFLSTLLALLTMVLHSCKDTPPNQYAVIPLPKYIEARSGGFDLSQDLVLHVNSPDEKLDKLVNSFADRLHRTFATHIEITHNTSDAGKKHRIAFLRKQGMDDEAYEIDINKSLLEITASSYTGFFYAIQTLYQLMPDVVYSNDSVFEGSARPEILCAKIADTPRFKYRGVLLDVARYFMTVEQMKKFIDLMGQSKLNRLQWHLTDDQGWRIEIKKYPKLTEIGSKRKQSEVFWHTNEFDGKAHQGYYTQEEIKEIVKYADERGIVIIPEIEIPGHAMAALASYPELSCGLKQKYEVGTTWGVYKDVYCPKESTFRFLEDVFKELFDLFPSPYYHIGGDECPKDAWKQCPHCQQKIKEEGLKDEYELQSYIIHRIENFLNSNGKQIIGWDEIREGGLAPNATVTVRNGEKTCREVLASSHPVIVTYAYLDYHQVPEKRSLDKCIQGGMLTLDETYNYKPVPDSLSNKEEALISGVECCVWTETISNQERLYRQVYPRLLAFSEVAWTDTNHIDTISFRGRLPLAIKRLERQMIKAYPTEEELNTPYSGWQAGEMDIHHIYTGRGESNFLIFPDSTSMLIDAGDWNPKDYPKMCEELPDSSRRAGAWIARYIQRVNPCGNEVDYLMVSHFHNDHTGDCTNPAPITTGRGTNYVMTGIAEVGETIHFKKVFDRGWPDYQYPIPISDPDVDNYRAFIRWKTSQEGLQQERFIVGQRNQIALLKKPEKYDKLFFIRNLAANGEIWNGEGLTTTRYYDLNPLNLTETQNENTKSLAIRIGYGPFTYYTGGDISSSLLDQSGNRINIEEKVAEVCGPVDVCKANHHAYSDAMSEGFIRNIQARNYIIPVWDYEHIQPTIMKRMLSQDLYSGERLIFPTNMPSTLQKTYEKENWMNSACSETGHVIVKVFDKGSKYKIYIISPTDERMIVKAIYGPFESNVVKTKE